MKIKFLFLLGAIVFVVACAFQGTDPWTQSQLMQPAELAALLSNPAAKQPVIFSIGPAGGIKNSIEIGQTKQSENLDKLRKQLNTLSRDTAVVIYCGCCPFVNCPNIRPAFRLLN